MKSTEEILVRTVLDLKYNLDTDSLIGLYPYGSTLYNTTTENSDIDLVAIIDVAGDMYFQYENEDVDIHFLSISIYKKQLEDHNIMALECHYNPNPYIPLSPTFEFRTSTATTVPSLS